MPEVRVRFTDETQGKAKIIGVWKSADRDRYDLTVEWHADPSDVTVAVFKLTPGTCDIFDVRSWPIE